MVLFGHPKDPKYVNEIDANGEVNATLGHLVIATYYAKMRTISRLEILGVFPISHGKRKSILCQQLAAAHGLKIDPISWR